MASFVGRRAELEKLDEVYESNKRLIYINAKDRSGSSTLVKKFCEKSKNIYVTFRETTASGNIRAFQNAIEDFINEPIGITNPSFADLFHVLSRYTREYDPILVFDGTHYVPEDFPPLIKWLSEIEPNMIILIGNDDHERFPITTMEILDLQNLTRKECNAMHPKMSDIDALRTYMAIGGSPLYHSLMNKPTFQECIEKVFMGNYPKLCAECELKLRRSSVPYPVCCAILSDLSNCIGRPVDIASKENISRQLCDIYLKKMVEEGLIRTVAPIGNAPKKPIYILNDPLIAFYFISIRGNPAIEFTEKPCYKDIENYVDMFMELRFRDICEQYLKRNYKCVKTGKWWMKDEDTNKPTLAAIIDVDGVHKTIVAECKFRSGKIDQGAMKAFMARADMIQDIPEKLLMMFSISGFEDKLLKKARAENILLIGPEEIF